MLRIQLDDRAVFLERWHAPPLDVLTPQAVAADVVLRRASARRQRIGVVAPRSIRSDTAVRKFRHILLAQLSDVLANPCKKVDKGFSIDKMDRTESPVWRLVSESPRAPDRPSLSELGLAVAGGGR